MFAHRGGAIGNVLTCYEGDISVRFPQLGPESFT